MDDATIENKLNELVNEIGTVPTTQKKKLIILTKKAAKKQRGLKASADSLQESLNYLRVSIKYLLFDLEATRRENVYLRKLISEKDQ